MGSCGCLGKAWLAHPYVLSCWQSQGCSRGHSCQSPSYPTLVNFRLFPAQAPILLGPRNVLHASTIKSIVFACSPDEEAALAGERDEELHRLLAKAGMQLSRAPGSDAAVLLDTSALQVTCMLGAAPSIKESGVPACIS